MQNHVLFAMLIVPSLALLAANPQSTVDKRGQANSEFKKATDAFQKGEYIEAIKHYRAANEILPQPVVRYHIAESLLRLDKKSEALAEFKWFVINSDPTKPEYILAHNALRELTFPPLTKEQQELLAEIDDHLAAAKELGDNGMGVHTAFNTAIGKMQELRKQQPDYVPLLKKLGATYEQKKQYMNATEAYWSYLAGYERLGFPAEDLREIRQRSIICENNIPTIERYGTAPIIVNCKNDITSICFSPDGKTIASGNWGNTIQLWDVSTGKFTFTLQDHVMSVSSVAYSPDGKTIVSGSADNTIRVWNTVSGKFEFRLDGHTNKVACVTFSPNGKTLASGSWDKTIRLWDIETCRCIKTLTSHGNSVSSIAYSPDGKTLASCAKDNVIRLWDAETGESTGTLTGHEESVTSLAFSPNGKILASGSWDTTIRLWDIETGKFIKSFTGHKNPVSSIAYSPSGNMLASGSWDTTIRLWDIETGKCSATLRGHTGQIQSVTFSPVSQALVSAGSDKSFRLWGVLRKDGQK